MCYRGNCGGKHEEIFLTVLVPMGLVFQLSSCGEAKLYTVLIKNEASKPVSYVYDGTNDTLPLGDSRLYGAKAYTQPPKNISVPGTMSVKMAIDGDTFTFMDTDEITLNVSNLLPFVVKLRADNYIDVGEDETEMEIKGTEKVTAKIYTARPNFTTVPRQCTVEWELNGSVMNVTIR